MGRQALNGKPVAAGGCLSLHMGDIHGVLAASRKLERVIRNRSTGKYYVANACWTSDARHAKIFEDLSLAFALAHNDGLQHCSVIVFRSGFREVDAQFPID